MPVLGDGERDDPGLRSTAVGLSLRHGRAAWARATLEGAAFGLRARLEALGRDREPVRAYLWQHETRETFVTRCVPRFAPSPSPQEGADMPVM